MTKRGDSLAKYTKTGSVSAMQEQIEQTLYVLIRVDGHAASRFEDAIKVLPRSRERNCGILAV